MNGLSPLQFALGVLTVATGGGVLQIIRYLIQRKPEIRSLETKTLADERTSSEPLFKEYREMVAGLKEAEKAAKLATEKMEARLDQDRREYTRKLEMAHKENERLSNEVANLRTDLDIAQGQVAQLQRQLRSMRLPD